MTTENGNKLEVESKTNQVEKGGNNPTSLMKVKVTELKTGFESKATINMYHTNQGFHIQGGRRSGNVTTCSLVADFLVDFFKNILLKNAPRIRNVKDVLLGLDLRKNYKNMQPPSKKMVKQMKALFNCTQCHYRTVLQTEMKRHNFKQHQHQKNLTQIESIDKKETKDEQIATVLVHMEPFNDKKTSEAVELIKVIQSNEPSKVEELLQAAIVETIPDTSTAGAKSSSDNKGYCLRCNFEGHSENELEIHMENVHQVPRPVPQAVHPDGRTCQDCKTKDTVITAQINKVERLELKITDIETDMKSIKLEDKNLIKEKENREKDYQEASKVIGDQQRNASENAEKIKVLEGLIEVEEAKRVAKQTDEWEEVWEDDNTGNLIPQKRKEVDKYQWKPDLACKNCDKVLQSDQHMRQHIKEHTRLQNQLIMCHHCDFATNDEVIHTNHMVDVHSTRHTCQSCSAVFPTKSDMIKHAGNDHGLVYNKNEGTLKSIDCHDCQECFHNKFELMQHKEANHYKKRLCSYYHGNGWGCRFLNKCLDIQNENITPVLTSDNRGKIEC